MAYQDRFTLTTKRFGRRVIIRIRRGKVKCKTKGKLTTVTIVYADGGTRKRKQ
jgi:hypothetical protein